ncbi:MAG: DUF3194 domain-containing protein [Candidatus Odinarchaeota archaeon]
MSHEKNLSPDKIAEIISRVEEYIRSYIDSKINRKTIDKLDIIIDVDYDNSLEVNVEIELDAGLLSEKYQPIIEEAVDLAHEMLEKELRG